MICARDRIVAFDFLKSLAERPNIFFVFFSFVNLKVIFLEFMIKSKYIKRCVRFNIDFSGCIVKPNESVLLLYPLHFSNNLYKSLYVSRNHLHIQQKYGPAF